MAGRIRLLLALGVAVLAVALAGCGGGGEESSPTAPPANDTGAAPAPADAGTDDSAAAAKPDRGGEQGEGEDAGAAKQGAKPGKGKGSPQPEPGGSAAGPDRTTDKGSFSPQSRKFRVPGGDNSIQTFGGEAASSERQAATATLKGYLDARAAGRWAESCRYMASEMVRSLEELVKNSPQLKDKDCGGIIAMLSSGATSELRRNPMAGGVVSLRIEGDRAFAMFNGTDGKGYFMPMARDGGEWKVASLAAVPF